MSKVTSTTAQKPVSRKEKNQGMNWCSQTKRLAIYLRDGLACCYCGSSVTDGVKLTLDHIMPYSEGGSNDAKNLVTCCHKCNSSRGNRSVKSFVEATAAYINHGITAEAILQHINNTKKRVLPTAEAKELISRQGSCFKVLQTLNK
jgi:hypothetical protein